jgi:hypothetical protein
MGFMFKFTLFYSGVLYLLNESKMRMSDVLIILYAIFSLLFSI